MKCLLLILSLALVAATTSAFSLRSTQHDRADHEGPFAIKGRIANGETASRGQFPYQVGLSTKRSFFASYWCGGSLIAHDWVLTAAHCTEGAKSVTVYLGATIRNEHEIKLTIKRDAIIIHENWDSQKLLNDISLIRIPSVAYSKYIQPVKLPRLASTYSNYSGDYAIASGWGRMGDSIDETATALQWARLQIAPNRICSRVYGSTPNTICLWTTGRVSTCQGDSGGPLVLEETGVQIGLTSYGAAIGCEKERPVVFTRLTSFLPWIQSNTGVIREEE